MDAPTLQDPVRLSRSLLWRLMRRSYTHHGPRAWSPGKVPHQAVTNPVQARACAEVLHAALRDLGPSDAPRTILELGSGSGRFGFYLLRAMNALGDAPPWRLVMTDLVEENLESWAASPSLRPFVEAGQVDFARLDAADPQPAMLHMSGDVFIPGESLTLVVANYLLDSLPADLLAGEDGALLERRIALASELPLDELLALPDPLESVEWALSSVPFAGYEDPTLDELARRYAGAIDGAEVLLPVGAVRCMEALADPSGRLILLSTDKGARDLQGLRWTTGLNLIKHGGVFSLAVNHHALGRYVKARGGFSLHPPHREPTLTSALSAPGFAPDELPNAHRAFRWGFATFTPRDAQRLLLLTDDVLDDAPDAELALRMLRLSGWDPHVLLVARRALLPGPDSMPPWLRDDWLEALDRTWENDYPLPGESDLAFLIGNLQQALADPVAALLSYQRSQERRGERPALLVNQGWCLLEIGQRPAARACALRALEMDPEMGSAQRLLAAIDEPPG